MQNTLLYLNVVVGDKLRSICSNWLAASNESMVDEDS